MTDWFKRFVGPNLVPFASEMVSQFVANLTQLPTKRVMRRLRESKDRMEALHNKAREEKSLMERYHQAALKAKEDSSPQSGRIFKTPKRITRNSL
uniref:Uncharacterized protein n=1 Tax=Cannabis sativa TaxID=3483 RepID=A0A803P606_CANSA